MEQHNNIFNINQNDKIFINEINREIDNEQNNFIYMNQNPPNLYNIDNFRINVILEFLKVNKIIHSSLQCDKCGKFFTLKEDNKYIDGYAWRCRGRNPPHDIRFNIRKDSVFELSRLPIQILFFLTYYCFLENKGITKSVIECNNFTKQIGLNYSISEVGVRNFFEILRKKIKDVFHKKWRKSFIGMEIGPNGYGAVEIDESEIIGNQEHIYWMFGLIDRFTREARVYCILENRTKQNLLPIIKNNVMTNELEGDEYNNVNESTKTRIYSDCFQSYQPRDFKEMGYILNRINHSIWFGFGLMHTNSIEGLWSQLKRLNNNFSGINFEIINQLEKKLINPVDYLNDWIFGLFIKNLCCIRRFI